MKNYLQIIENIIHHNTSISEYFDYDWFNVVYKGNYVKSAHIQLYERDNIEVFHFVITPPLYNNMPIFGFDIVKINGKTTFICADMSPTSSTKFKLETSFKSNSKRPIWAHIFSPEALLYKPKSEKETEVIFDEIITNLYSYFRQLRKNKFNADPSKVLEKVREYNNEQRKNSKTLKVLITKEGKETAEKFVKELLFPDFNMNKTEIDFQEILNRGNYIKEKTKKAHSEAEKTDLSKNLVKGNINKNHYTLYLHCYERIFNEIKNHNFESASRFQKLFETDLLNSNNTICFIQSLNDYLMYLESISKEQIESHLYVCSLGHMYGGKWIAKSLDDSFSKHHLTETNNDMIFEIRKNTKNVSAEEANKSYKFIKQIYEEIWQN